MISSAIRPVLAPLLLACTLIAPTLGCGSELGTHTLTIDGSEAVEQGVSTADNWDVSFEQVVVVVHDPGLIERVNNEPAWVRENGVTVWDVIEDQGLTRQIRATRYDGADFRIGPLSASDEEPGLGNVDDDLLDAAVEDDWSIRVVGSATNMMMQTVTFDWSFDTNTLYRCEFEGDEVVELGAEGDETTSIEILAEVLLAAEDGSLAFGPIADADADGDRVVTKAELESAELWDGIEALSKTIGGVRGAGACPVVEE